jgi:hypothetical protein
MKNHNKPQSAPRVGSSAVFGGWISVKNKLPLLGEKVLVCEHGEITTLAVRVVKGYGELPDSEIWSVIANCSGYECDDNPCEPEFWMSLPNPPNVGQKQKDENARA